MSDTWPEERSYPVDPSHPDFGRIEAETPVPIAYDPRLFTATLP